MKCVIIFKCLLPPLGYLLYVPLRVVQIILQKHFLDTPPHLKIQDKLKFTHTHSLSRVQLTFLIDEAIKCLFHYQ